MDTAIMRQILREDVRTLFGRCIYCGDPCYGRSCLDHRDLLQLDPTQHEMRLRQPPQLRQPPAVGSLSTQE